MSTPFERYKKRLAGSYDKTGTNDHRKAQAIMQIQLSFTSADGYFKGYKKGKNDSESQDYDFLIKHTLVGQEKKIITRPMEELPAGTYIKYKPRVHSDREIIMIVRECLLDDDLMPSYKAYVCQDVLRLEGCPVEFPVYGFNSTYSSKGVIDVDKVYSLDSRNKIYVQRNEYTIQLFRHHRNYRIVLGSEETKYTYFITEMDDISYPGMFVISLKIDERHPNDNDLYAYNETKIQFVTPSNNNNTNKDKEPLEIECDDYYYVGDQITIIGSNELTNIDVSDFGLVSEIKQQDDNTYVLECKKPGLLTITVEDKYKNKVEKNIIIK